MALAALIAAGREAEDGSGLIATLPLAGRALVEHQARLAAAAGARHIVILVERLPAALTAAIDRLRRDGLGIEVARSVADAADHIHPDERLLLFADGVVAAPGLVQRLADAPLPALLVADDGAGRQHWERIDAAARWTGLALVNGARLRRTAAMLGDWDLQATLLRQTLGEGARRIGIADGADLAAAPIAVVVSDRAGAAAASRAVALVPPAAEAGGWPSRHLYPLLAAPAARLLATRRVEADWLRGGAVLLALAALGGFLGGAKGAALAALLVSGPLDAAGRRLAAVRLGPGRHDRALTVARGALGAAALVALGVALWREGWGWGCAVLGLAAVAGLQLCHDLRRTGAPAPAWLADLDAAAIVVLPFALAGNWSWGLGAAAGYAAGAAVAALRLRARGAARTGLAAP